MRVERHLIKIKQNKRTKGAVKPRPSAKTMAMRYLDDAEGNLKAESGGLKGTGREHVEQHVSL